MNTIKPALWVPGINLSDDLATGLRDHWPFWAGTGERVGNLVGNNEGTMVNMDPATSWVKTTKGRALNFDDGTSGEVNIPKNLGSSVGSIVALVNPTFGHTGTNLHSIFGDVDGGGPRVLTLQYSGFSGTRQYVFSYRGNFGSTTTVVGTQFSSDAVLQRWQLIVATWDALGTSHIYQDGILTGSDSTVSNVWDGAVITAFQIGRVKDARTWDGDISFVSLYDRAINLNEIKTLRDDPYGLITPPKRTYLRSTVAPAAGGVSQILGGGILSC